MWIAWISARNHSQKERNPHMTKRIATAVAVVWLLGFIGNMALFASRPVTTSDKVLASALWPVGLIVSVGPRGAMIAFAWRLAALAPHAAREV